MSGGAAIPELIEFSWFQERYWARETRIRASFVSNVGPWSDWSEPFVSNKTQRGVEPLFLVANAQGQQQVFFELELSPLFGETEPTIQPIILQRNPNNAAQFYVPRNMTPAAQYVNVTNGITADGGVRQGRAFYINRNNQQTYVAELQGSDAAVLGLWSLDELCQTISRQFALNSGQSRISGVRFDSVPGTLYVRIYLNAATTNYPSAGPAGPGSAEFRVYPYTNRQEATYLPSDRVNGTNTLNRALGFGPIPDPGQANSWPQTSGLNGNVGYWPVQIVA
jgi:hypothetical protein